MKISSRWIRSRISWSWNRSTTHCRHGCTTTWR